jgi:hypothetical protein
MDIGSYRLNERLANAVLPSWRIKAVQRPHVFHTHGFPVHVDSTDELVSVLDTMQENRFARYLSELGGLDETDLATLVNALADYCLFFRTHFPAREAPLPLSTMIAHLTLAKKLRGIGPPYRILEIGPGCGYLSFLLRQWTDLQDYCQIETTESFYILQNLINKFLFRHRFRDLAQTRWEPDQAAGFVTASSAAAHATEISPRIPLDIEPTCRHFPWWRIGDVAKEQFNVVTTNATLNEFSADAFRQYVWLIDQCLAKDGCLLVQCYGGGPAPLDNILQSLFAIKLAPVVLMLDSEVTFAGKFFTNSNLLFVRERHPLYNRYATPKVTVPLFEPQNLLVKAVYLPESAGPRREVAAIEIAARVAKQLLAIDAPGPAGR